jgi:serine/threonine protein kinase
MFKPRIFGKYLLVERIGFGGIGEVYKAKAFGINGYQQLVAIKTIRAVFSDEQDVIELFRNEALLSLTLDHKNVIKVYDYGKIKDKHYLAMEYIHGRDLRSIIKRAQQKGSYLPLPYALYIMSELTNGLAYIHNTKNIENQDIGIIHRDISPSNIIISYNGDIKIIDFGVAKTENPNSLTQDELFVGKLKYASPEQIELKKLDHRSDIFATGILFYEMVTNQNPFEGDTEVETIKRIKKGTYQTIKKINPDIPEQIEKIIKKAMEPAPENRYSTAANFRDDIINFMQGKNIIVKPKELIHYMERLFIDAPLDIEDQAESHREDYTIISDTARVKISESGEIVKIEQTQPKIKKEKKNVAVLGIEIQSIKDLVGKMNKEELSAIMNEIFKKMIDVIYKYEGRIDKLYQKKLIATFGVPKIHEDDAKRSIDASFQIKNHINTLETDLKIKINYKIIADFGSLIVSYEEADINSYTLSGNVIDRVEGLFSSVPFNTITSTEEMLDLEGLTFDKIGQITIQNQTCDYYSISLNEIKVEKLAKKILSKFVGRIEELNTLNELFLKAKNNSGQVISIQGDIGTGKTRLTNEFTKNLPLEECVIFDTNAKQLTDKNYKKGLSYWLLLDLVKKIADIQETDSEGILKKKLIALTQYSIDERDVALLAKLFSVDLKESSIEFLEGKKLKFEIFLSLKKLLISLAKNRVLVITFDDLQWADVSSLEFLEYLAKYILDEKVLLICLSRPEIESHFKDLSCYTEIELELLTQNEASTLIDSILQDRAKNEPLKSIILTKSEGNPLFIEEIIKSVQEGKDIVKMETILPKTLQGLLASRIDSLDEKTKLILKCASVIGKNFKHELLEKVVHDNPELSIELADYLDIGIAHLIKSDILYPNVHKNEIDYAFKHSLSQEVAYNSILDDMLMKVHFTVGESIEDIFEERLDEYYEVLAHHFELAQSVAKTFHYYELSGSKLQKSYVIDEAINYFSKAKSLLTSQKLDLDPLNIKKKTIDLNQHLLEIYYQTGNWNTGLSINKETINLSEEIHDKRMQAKSLHTLARFYKAIGQWKKSLEYLNHALIIAANLDDKFLVCDLKREIGGIYNFMGDTATALKYIEEGLSIARILNDEHIIAKYQNDRGLLYCKKEQFDEALDCFTSSIKFKQKVNDKFGVGVSIGNIVDVYYSKKEYEKALEYCKDALKTVEEIKDSWGIAVNLHNIGDIYFQLKKYSEAINVLEKSLKISREIGWERGVWLNNIYLDYLNNQALSVTTGISKLKEDLEKITETPDKECIAKANFFLGLLYNSMNDPDNKFEALIYFKRALEIAKEIDAKYLIENIQNNLKTKNGN